MLKTKIKPENSQIIDALLDLKQRKCKARLLSYRDILEASMIAESLLEPILAKQHRQNIMAIVMPFYEEIKPHYAGTPEHTECLIQRGRKDWYIMSVDRAKAIRKGSSKVEILTHSLQRKHSNIIQKVTKNLSGNSITI